MALVVIRPLPKKRARPTRGWKGTGRMGYKVLKAASDPDPNLDLDLASQARTRVRIKIRIKKAIGRVDNGEGKDLNCHFHRARRGRKGGGRREKGEMGRMLGRRAGAFTLIEMIGVLAVIAILAALLIPKVFNAINDARINNACVSLNSIKTVVVDHAGKYGQFNMLWGTNSQIFPMAGYDTNVLMAEGLIDKPFSVRISTNASIELVQGGAGTACQNANGG